MGKGSCKWKIGLNFEANLPSEFGNLSICLLDSRCSVLGRFLVEENQSSDKKEKLHWAKLWTPIKWICMFICISLSLTYPSWRLGCQFGLRKSEKGNLNIHVPQQVKNEDMSRRRSMVWKWKLSLTTRQQQKHTQTFFHLTVKKEMMKSGKPKKRMILQSYQKQNIIRKLEQAMIENKVFQGNLFPKSKHVQTWCLNFRTGETMILKSWKHDKFPEKGNDDPQWNFHYILGWVDTCTKRFA